MRLFKCSFAALLFTMVLAAGELSAKGKAVPSIYIFGFSASFTDSTIYMTNVQKVDSAWIDNKSKFLLGRENYSYQLRNYLSDKLHLKNRTCLVMYARSRKEAEKKYLKLKKLYVEESPGMYDVRYIDEGDFKFQTIDMSYEEGDAVTPPAQDSVQAR